VFAIVKKTLPRVVPNIFEEWSQGGVSRSTFGAMETSEAVVRIEQNELVNRK
jgi:hypothetical protein